MCGQAWVNWRGSFRRWAMITRCKRRSTRKAGIHMWSGSRAALPLVVAVIACVMVGSARPTKYFRQSINDRPLVAKLVFLAERHLREQRPEWVQDLDGEPTVLRKTNGYFVLLIGRDEATGWLRVVEFDSRLRVVNVSSFP